MNKKIKIVLIVVILPLAIIALVASLLHGYTVDILMPQGQIAEKQRNLIIFAALLSLIVVIPVYILATVIALRYRESNTKAHYAPNWNHSKKLELIWWIIPAILILILSVVTWVTSHRLDPFKPLDSDKKALTVQVVALDWKWLFIYPEQNIATVNTLTIPEKTPINFEITSDAPMNSFWIPRLGGQIYAMSGMSTKLHLDATSVGTYRGSSANISGEGFAGMNFPVYSLDAEDFAEWAANTNGSSGYLSLERYNELAQPSKNNPPTHYTGVQPNLYATILDKYMSGYHTASEHNSKEVAR